MTRENKENFKVMLTFPLRLKKEITKLADDKALSVNALIRLIVSEHINMKQGEID